MQCNVVIQYMCEDTPFGGGIRDGSTTNTIPQNLSDPAYLTFGQHENYDYYRWCSTRERNKGLFIADQNLQGDRAIFTRQNANGNRYGFECPEERDYYPYFHATPWRDVMVCTDEPGRCGYYQGESQNVKDRGNCSDGQYNNRGSCETNGAIWSEGGKWNTSAPDCMACPTTRDNHLGNARSLSTPKYTWFIPQGVHADNTKCVLRVRYNTTSGDFDGWNTFSLYNGANSPVKGM